MVLAEPVSLAFLMGVAAVFNPCGIALLPATMAWVGGTVLVTPRWVVRSGQGAGTGLLMAVGFTAVVAVVALLIRALGLFVGPVLRPVMLGMAGALILGGGLVGIGLFHFPIDRWVRWDPRPRGHRGWTLLVAGVIYGTAALSCTLPLFLAAFIPALSAGTLTFVQLVAAFGLGAALVLVGVSELTLFARDTTIHLIQRVGPWLNPVLGLMVAAAGSYLLYYWLLGPGRFLA